ncbi:YecA/YgfB family protein [Azohydromonas caseinilytica]|uniref:UPF0149 family protein n=1 Tax=Azohydromonas caseinilytica TaxID=2728836 RepID=A0A848F5K4_9BURK|nr:UPF0149 family protein [Azohydromonas caseinilytica]NML13879.1 UPF0149 family protein [Azohydromonas caseinilytica]
MKQDLTDQELAELDELLAATPEPLQPLDIVMLDGYLCGVLVQPELLDEAQWLPPIFDIEQRPLPDDVDAEWLQRCSALIRRRYEALNRALAEDGAFDPVILDPESEPEDGEGAEDELPLSEYEQQAAADAKALQESLPEASRPLMPWVVGFQHAALSFPKLMESEDDAVDLTLARVFRHLPAQTDEEREVLDTMQRELPLASVDEAIDDLVMAVAELWDLTSDQRYAVEQVRRDTPKVGRNDPCPCGSGKKFKQCHGKS